MVLPLADDNSDRRLFPYVNVTLIVLNALVFVFLQGFGANDKFTLAWATVPHEIVTGSDEERPERVHVNPNTNVVYRIHGTQKSTPHIYLTLLVSMFMHASFLHIGGNMLFLYIFGDNVEDAMGHFRYAIFYLACGLLASLAHVFMTVMLYGANSKEAMVPSLGASGAISGVLGGYLLLYPHKRVTAIVFNFLSEVPAFVAIGMWFVFQLISGLQMLGGRGPDGVAYAAHVGGFVAGLVLVKLFTPDTDAVSVRPEPFDPDDRW